jgi:hypothetical protein
MGNPFKRKTFTAAHKQAFTTLYSLSTVVENAPNIMVRVNTESLSADKSLPWQAHFDDVDTFVITTSANSDNTIFYKSPTNKVDLSITDGGFF